MLYEQEENQSLDTFPAFSGNGIPQVKDTRITQKYSSAIEAYNAANSGFDHNSPLSGGKVILVGDSTVGKTCLFVRISKNQFGTHYKPTIGLDFNVKKYKIYGIPFTLAIWDTAGQERFKSLTKTYHRGSNAVILTFDLNNQKSVKSIENWYKEVKTFSEEPNLKVFLVGTKSDLYHAVDKQEAINLANKLNAEYWEVSAKNDFNVKELFDRIAFVVWSEQLFKWNTTNKSNPHSNSKNEFDNIGTLDTRETNQSGGADPGGCAC